MEPDEEESKIPQNKRFVIEDVYESSVEKLVANPVLVSYKTQPSKITKPEMLLYKEPYSEGNRLGHRYKTLSVISGLADNPYVGSNYRSKNHEQDEIVLLGVLDKTSGRMKLVEVEQFSVAQDLTGCKNSALQNIGATSGESVVTIFGTKRAIKNQAVIQIEKERQSTNAVESVIAASEGVDAESFAAQVSAMATDYHQIAPTINENASRASEVYSMQSIVSDAVLKSLIPEAKQILQQSIADNESLSTLFLTCWSSAKLELDEDSKLRHACASIYIEHLRRFVSNIKLDFSTMTDELSDQFVKTFSASKSNKRHNVFKDKAVAHLLVLAMIINKFQLNLSVVINSVALHKRQLLNIIAVLRMRVRKETIVLTLPLPPPVRSFDKAILDGRKKRKFR